MNCPSIKALFLVVHKTHAMAPKPIHAIFISRPTYYSLRFKLLVVEMDVCRTKIHLDTSIRATNNSERREYLLGGRRL